MSGVRSLVVARSFRLSRLRRRDAQELLHAFLPRRRPPARRSSLPPAIASNLSAHAGLRRHTAPRALAPSRRLRLRSSARLARASATFFPFVKLIAFLVQTLLTVVVLLLARTDDMFRSISQKIQKVRTGRTTPAATPRKRRSEKHANSEQPSSRFLHTKGDQPGRREGNANPRRTFEDSMHLLVATRADSVWFSRSSFPCPRVLAHLVPRCSLRFASPSL